MIDCVNNTFLSDAQRRAILFRAQHSQPFFDLLQFDVVGGGQPISQFQAKINVDKDYFVTEYQGNFNDVFLTSNSKFDVALYTELTNKSLWRFLQGQGLFSGMILEDARFDAPFATQLFDDRQHECMPYKIMAGDRVIGQIRNLNAKLAPAIAYICLKGYYTLDNQYFSPSAIRGINESLAAPIKYEFWKETVDFEGQRTVKFDNDRTARLVLGFGIADMDIDKALLAGATIDIVDSLRGLKFSNNPLPIQFLAPRLCSLRDTHIYYLPTEYLFEPFASLECKIDCSLNGGDGFDLMLLTRTV